MPRQDSWDAARVQAVNEKMHFSIWTGLAAHQPLGNINRARRETYQHSAGFRERFNGGPAHEPGARAGVLPSDRGKRGRAGSCLSLP